MFAKIKACFALIFFFSLAWLAAQNTSTNSQFGTMYSERTGPAYCLTRPLPDPETNTILGLSEGFGDMTGRFAFRYFVINGVVTGTNSNFVGIDRVEFRDCHCADFELGDRYWHSYGHFSSFHPLSMDNLFAKGNFTTTNHELNTKACMSLGQGSGSYAHLDTALLSDAWRHLLKAKKLTEIGIGFGAIGNLSILLITPALFDKRPEDVVWAGLIGFPFSTARFFISFAPPSKLLMAKNNLLLYQEYTDGKITFEETMRHLTVARKAAIAVPVLGLVGMVMIPAGIAGINNDRTSGYVFWLTGWGCAIAGLTTTVISGIHISRAIEQLNREKKGLNMGLNPYGLGLGYRF